MFRFALRQRSLAMLSVIAILFALSISGTVRAATIIADGNVCTLMDAIRAANTDTATGGCPAGSGADTIEMTMRLITQPHGGVDGCSVGLPPITSTITINGHGLNIERGPHPSYGMCLFYVTSSGNLTLNDLTLKSGYCMLLGGAIYNSGTVNLNRSTVTNSSSGQGGGGIFNGGTLIITDSTISNNVAGDLPGGGIYNVDRLILIASTVSGNHAGHGGGIENNDGHTTMINSTVSGNSASTLGGGIRNVGTLDVTYSTISGNSAAEGGGISNSGMVIIGNSIIANSPGGDCAGTNYTATNNRATGACGSIAVTGLDATLGNHGGPTVTHALMNGSNAIDSGTSCPRPYVDQRGFDRPQDDACDIGAYESSFAPRLKDRGS